MTALDGLTTIDDLIEALPTGVLFANDAGVIVRVNAAAERLFGLDRGALLGSALGTLVPVADTRASGMAVTSLRRQDGTTFEASVGFGRVTGPREGLLVVAIASPIPAAGGHGRAESAARPRKGRGRSFPTTEPVHEAQAPVGPLDRPATPAMAVAREATADAPPPAEPARPAGSGPAPAIPRRERVMYVDDEEAIVLVATRRLGRLGYQVSGYTDVRQALDDFRAQPDAYDVVVTDVAMPGMSGFEFGRAIKAVRAATPLLMTSGYAGPEDQQLARDLGAIDFIQKPHTVVELERALDRVFEERRVGPTPT